MTEQSGSKLKILFICHGNICRSTMAQCVMAHLLHEAGIEDVVVDSAATSCEELGNGIHPGTKRELTKHGVPILPHYARRITIADAEKFDLIIGMDEENMWNLRRMLPKEFHSKIHLLLEYAGRNDAIADPWYTGNFSETWQDVLEGCQGLLKSITKC